MSDSDQDEQKAAAPKIYLLPNLMTAGNLFCGFLAILMIFKGMRDPASGAGDYFRAIALILGACVFDLLDGRVARMRGQESLFGREFDSLADIVSFGVAPALLVMDIVLNDFSDRLGWITAFVYLLCGGMRLARFNCIAAEDSESSSKDFRGFPIPAAAGVIASITVFLLWLNEGDKELGAWKYGLLLLMWLLSFLMLSEFRYPSFKHINWKTRRSLPWVFLAVLAIVCSVFWWKVVPAAFFTLYLVYGLIRPWVSKRWRRGIEEPDKDDDIDGDDGAMNEMDLQLLNDGDDEAGDSGKRQSEAS
jgi:CDP-diacylglycerol--serine O-phosphatidyltransferase